MVHADRDAAEVDVEDEPLIREVAVDIAEVVGNQDGRRAPRARVGLVAVHVDGRVGVGPREELDGLGRPLHGVDAPVAGAPGIFVRGSRGTALVVPDAAVRVAVAVGDEGGLPGLANSAGAVLRGVIGVNGRLVDVLDLTMSYCWRGE